MKGHMTIKKYRYSHTYMCTQYYLPETTKRESMYQLMVDKGIARAYRSHRRKFTSVVGSRSQFKNHPFKGVDVRVGTHYHMEDKQ